MVCFIKQNKNNKMNIDNQTSRRELMHSLGRGALLIGLAAVSVFTVSQKNRSADETCSNNFICRNCTALTKCRLPQALSLKQVLTKR